MEFYAHELKDFQKSNHRRFGSVYLVGTRGLKYLKIGRSKCASLRLGMLQVGCPMDLHMIASLKTPLSKDIEQHLHSSMSHCHVRGEWYSPRDADIDFLMSFFELTKKHIDTFDNDLAEGWFLK